MSDVQLAIRIVADAKGARAELVGTSQDVARLSAAAKAGTSGLTSLGTGLDKVASSGRSAEGQIKNTVSVITGRLIPAVKEADTTTGKAAQSIGGMGASFMKLAAAAVSIEAVRRSVVGLNAASDRVALMDARLKLVTDSSEGFRAVQAALYQQSQSLGTGIEGQTQLYIKLARATEGTGRAASDLLAVTKTIGQGLKISGASAEEQTAALYQLAQGMASGKLQGDELRSVLEGMPVVATAVEKSLGLARGGLRDFASQGKLTTDVFIEAVLKIKDFDAQVARMPKTFGEAMTRMGNSVLEWSAALSKSLGITDAFVKAFNEISYKLDRSAGRTDPRADAVRDVQQAYLKLYEAQKNFDRAGSSAFADEARRLEAKAKAAAEVLDTFDDKAKQASTALDPLSKGFGQAAYQAEQVGRRMEDTIMAIAEQAKKSGEDIAASLALAGHESQFRQYDKNGNVLGSSAGPSSAKGIYQIVNGTAEGLGIDPKDPFQNIRGGITLLGQLKDKYDSLAKAVTAYYIGESQLNKMLKQRGSIDLEFIPKGNKTTVGAYLADVEKRFNEWQKKYPSGLKFWDEKSLDQQGEAAKRMFDQQITSAAASAKAQETVAKSVLAVDVQTLEQRAAAYQRYVQSTAADLKGDEKIRFLQQAASVEQSLLDQTTQKRLQAIAIEEQATRSELVGIQQQINSADNLNRTEAERASALDKRKALEAELTSLSAQRQAIEIQASGEAARLSNETADAVARETKEVEAAATARKEFAQSIEDQIRALQAGNTEISHEAELRKLSADMTKEEAKAWEEFMRKRMSVLNEYNKAAKDQEKREQAVREEQLRMNATMEDAVRQAKEFATAMTTAFGQVGDGIGGLVTSFADYNQRIYQVQRDTQNAIESSWRDVAQATKDGPKAAYDAFMKATAEEEYQRRQEMLKSAQYQVAAFGDMAQAARGFFKEGSEGYNAMTNAMKVLRIVEAAFTVASIAASFARGQAKAAEAVANQASGGDVYTAFPRMAAMVAAMAALGFGVAGAFAGGGSAASAETRQKNGGTGTVFGDSSAKSESLSKAIEIVAKNSTTDLAYSAGMLRALQNIESAMAGVTNSVIRNVGPAQVQGLGTKPMFSSAQMAVMGMDQLLGSILWKTTKKITDWGIGAFPQSLKTILDAGFKGITYTDVTTTSKFIGMTLSQSTKTIVNKMASETEKQFTLVFQSIADATREASKAFGISGDEFNRAIEGFVVKFDQTSLKGLKGEELQKAIEAEFSKIADQLAGGLNIKELDTFQRAGEGMFETLVRVSENITRANAELDALGIKAIKYTEVQYRQGDVAAEIVRQSIVAFEGLNSGIGKFMEEATGSAEDLIATYQDLVASRDILKGLGLGWQDLNRTMTEAVGGVSEFRSALESFRDNFYNAGEQYSANMTSLAREFGQLGLVLPTSKEQFRALAESIDTSTESGAELFARVIKLSEAFSQAADQADALEKKYKSFTDPFASFKDQIDQVMSDFESILSARLGGIEAKFSNQATLEKGKINNPLQAEISRLGGIMGTRQSEVAQEYAYIAQAQSRITELQDMVNRAMASGNSKLAGYVRSWMGEIDSLNGMIGTLNSDIAAKSKDIDSMNRQISELQSQIAQNSANVDTSLLSDKLKALTQERAKIVRQEGNVLVQTMKDIWEQVAGVIDDARQSLARQIAELKGGRALLKNSIEAERDAIGNLRDYQKSGGRDPQKTVELVSNAQAAIMQRYNDELERLTNELSKVNREAERLIRAEYRAKEREVTRQLNADKREINKQSRADIREVERDSKATVREIQRAGNAAINQYKRQVDAQINSINIAEQAAQRALEDAQQAQQDALQENQDARMQALQDAQQEEQKALQKTHEAQMKALQDQLSTAQQLQQAYKQIADYAKSITVGDLSTLSPEQKLAEAQKQYEDTLAKARAGDAEAAAQYTQKADAYARLAQSYYGSGTQYDSVYRKIQGDATGLGAMTTQVDPIQKAIEDLQTQQEKETEALQKTQREESKALQKVFQTESRALSRQQQDASEALRNTFQTQIDKLNATAQRVEAKMGRDVDKQINRVERESQRTINQIQRETDRQIARAERIAEKQMAKLEREQTRAINALTDPNKNEAIKQLRERTVLKLEKLDLVLSDAKKQAANHALKQIEYLHQLNILNTRQLRQLNKIGESMQAGTTDVPAFAAGGVMSPGLATVAERGIEPIWFAQGGRVLSNEEAKRSLTQSERQLIAKLEELKAEMRAIVKQNAAAYPRIAGGIEVLTDVSEMAARLAKSRPVAKA